jgi:hypothetical protein
VGNEAEITGRKEGERNQGKHRATRAGRPVEEPVSRRERKSGDEVPEADAASEGRSIMSRKMTKEEHEVPESSTRDEKHFGKKVKRPEIVEAEAVEMNSSPW